MNTMLNTTALTKPVIYNWYGGKETMRAKLEN